ncbi:MAG: type II toxin-antitoxin system RelE/ParE family toxin [Nitrospinota bacterium]
MSDGKDSLRIFKNAWFKRFARRKKISDKTLKEAIARVEEGAVDADLGGNVLKQRIARPGQGKSGGYRTIIVFKQGDKAFFVYGFAKSERENIDKDEIAIFKKSAKALLALSDEQIQKLIENEGLTEIKS